jgi:hypothetical protein
MARTVLQRDHRDTPEYQLRLVSVGRLILRTKAQSPRDGMTGVPDARFVEFIRADQAPEINTVELAPGDRRQPGRAEVTSGRS